MKGVTVPRFLPMRKLDAAVPLRIERRAKWRGKSEVAFDSGVMLGYVLSRTGTQGGDRLRLAGITCETRDGR